jgi:hypothetical protein
VLDRMSKVDGLAAAHREAESDYEAASGRASLADGDQETAIAALKRAVYLDPGEADVYLLLARAHTRAAQGCVEEEWESEIREARAACRRTRAIGGEQHPDAIAAKKLEEELTLIEAEAHARARAAATEQVADELTEQDEVSRVWDAIEDEELRKMMRDELDRRARERLSERKTRRSRPAAGGEGESRAPSVEGADDDPQGERE